MIVACEPKPGRPFARAEQLIVVPDVIVVKSGRNWKATLNPDVMPKLRVSDLYAQAIRGQRGGGNLSARLQEARWFIRNIQQRFDTILRVSAAIVERQKNFFTHGEIAMKPLVLREIADELGLHESTISRVTTAKYMATPQGTFELKYFFGSSLNTDAGGNASSTAVRALIKQFVAAEDAKKPLSDSQIADMLEEQGIQVARRTVAKYREALKIAPANLRKAYDLDPHPGARRSRSAPRGAGRRSRPASSVRQGTLFLPCAAGTEPWLAEECQALLGPQARVEAGRGGVYVEGGLPRPCA
jgi:RNA polymerase sigma-54 factor